MNEYKYKRKKVPMDLGWVVDTARRFATAYNNTELISFRTDAGISDGPEVHVTPAGLLEVAPVEKWEWSDRSEHDEKNKHGATVTFNGVQFCAIFTDGKRAEVERGE